MALLLSLIALLLGAFALGLSPYAVHVLGGLIGSSVQSRTQHRRELLLARSVSREPAEGNAEEHPSHRDASSTSLDEDWEKVNAGPGTPPNATSETNRVNTAFKGVVGFFHPYCNAGGGGERVLFAAIEATQHHYPNALCVVYTGDHDASKEQILTNVKNRFNIDLKPSTVEFLYLSTREYVHASKWPHFTLLGQSVGSLILGWEAFNLIVPDVLVDTMGYAFVLALCKWLFPRVPTGAYVHYPTISTDMLSSLHDEMAGRGLNAGMGKGLRGKVKQYYWELFAKLYGWVGGSIDVVMTNSTWTQGHVSALWGPARTKRRKDHAIEVVYPPCAVAELQEKIPVDGTSEQKRTKDILYIAQFRPEKMHHVIIDAFSTFLKRLPADESKPKLILVGSVRDDTDEKRVYKLRLQAQDAKDHIQFVVNAKWPQILDFLRTSSVGVNGMWNEHFGIGVVEYQAAGLISVVNNSGGPKVDIVVDIDGQPTGMAIYSLCFVDSPLIMS